MNAQSFQQLAENGALLLAVVFIFDVVALRWRTGRASLRQASIGLIIGAIGIGVMLTPWTFTPGIVFDTRSVLLGISGLFFGAAPTLVAMALTAAFRLYQGGGGAWTGVAVILATGTLGIARRHLRRRPLIESSWLELYLFGLVIHLVMLALMFTLPWATALRVLAAISLPVLAIYPLTTAALGALMVNRLRREQTVATLRESEARFREISSAITDIAYACVRRPDGDFAITWVTGATARITGHAIDEVKAFGCWDRLVLEEDRPAFEQYVTGLTPGATGECELRLRRRDGSVAWVASYARCVMLPDDSGRPRRQIYGALADITERKQTEIALRLSEERFRTVFEKSTVGYYLTALDGQLIKINQAFAGMLGYSLEELSRVNFAEITHPDDLAASREYMRCLLAGEQDTYRIEKRYYHKDGHIVWAIVSTTLLRDEQNAPLYFITNVHDITEHKRVEEALRESNRRLSALNRVGRALAETPELPAVFRTAYEQVALLVDAPCFGISLYDPATRTLRAGYMFSDGELLDAARFPPLAIDLDQPLRGRARVLLTEQPEIVTDMGTASSETVTIVSATAGGPVARSALYMPLVARGHIIGLLETQSYRDHAYDEADIELLRLVAIQIGLAIENARLFAELQVERDSLAQRVRDRTAQLEAANQELEAFAYSVSHDLRAPLRVLDGFSAALLADYPDKLDAQGQHYLGRIQDASRRMGQLINDLLNLSRVTRRTLSRQTVDLSSLAREIVAEMQARAAPAHAVEFTIADKLVVDGDPHLLRIALENLLYNAEKFSSMRSPARIEVGVTEQAGQSVYFIRDNGVGFDMAYADKLFIPFQRLHSVHEFPGTGIGLVTVQRIITRHGGRIWPEAEVDKGATFYFTLGGV